MKRIVFLYLMSVFILVPKVVEGEGKNVWIFPTSGYRQYINEYEKRYFDSSKYWDIDFASSRKHGGQDYPFIVADDDYIYLREGFPRYRIDKSTIRTEADGFQNFPEDSKKWVVLLGGGYYASNRIPPSNSDLFIAGFQRLREARKFLLLGQIDKVHPELLDTSFILPQVIKSVHMSAPFLEETIRGIHYTYDDDILLYRWFYDYLNRGNVAMYFINDPTPMVEGAPGNGVGLTIDIEYHLPSDNLVVLNGFVDLERRHLYKNNARMKKVLVQGDGFEVEYEFQDYVHFAQIDFPKKVTHVRLTVLEVYDGSRYDDLCISGLFTNPDILHTKNSQLAYELLEEAKKEWMEGQTKN